VGGNHRGEDAARARCQQVRVLAAGDLVHRIEPVQDRLTVGVEALIPLFCSWIAP
jgi:hypothetical protein